MGKFEEHLGETKELVLKRKNGEKDIFTIKPLPYEYLGKLLEVSQLLEAEGDDIDSSILTGRPMELIQELALTTMTNSYPDEKLEVMEAFTKQNLFHIMPVMFEVNQFSMTEEMKNAADATVPSRNKKA